MDNTWSLYSVRLSCINSLLEEASENDLNILHNVVNLQRTKDCISVPNFGIPGFIVMIHGITKKH